MLQWWTLQIVVLKETYYNDFMLYSSGFDLDYLKIVSENTPYLVYIYFLWLFFNFFVLMLLLLLFLLFCLLLN